MSKLSCLICLPSLAGASASDTQATLSYSTRGDKRPCPCHRALKSSDLNFHTEKLRSEFSHTLCSPDTLLHVWSLNEDAICVRCDRTRSRPVRTVSYRAVPPAWGRSTPLHLSPRPQAQVAREQRAQAGDELGEMRAACGGGGGGRLAQLAHDLPLVSVAGKQG